MRRNSGEPDRPILVIPRKAKIEIPEAAADSSSASSSSTSITIHAAAGDEASEKRRATGKRRGEAAEAAFLARATHLGFGVLLPWGESDAYDAAVDSRRRRLLLRVQVKSAGSFNAGYVIKTTRVNGRVYTLDDIDFLVGYVVPEDIWYVIPVEALGKRTTIKFRPHSRRLVKPMFERYREAWCLLDCPREKRGRNDIPKACRSEELGVRCAVCPKKRLP
jgi:PD-(D/E)XK endonuclease